MTSYIAGIIYGGVLGAAITAVAMLLWAASRRHHAQTDRAVVRVLHGSGHVDGDRHLVQYFDLTCDECGTEWSGATPLPKVELALSQRIGEVSPRKAEVRS